MATLRERIETAYDFARRQLGEASTVRGIILFAGSGSVFQGWIAADRFPVVMMVTSVLLILLPDDLPWKKS